MVVSIGRGLERRWLGLDAWPSYHVPEPVPPTGSVRDVFVCTIENVLPVSE